MKVFLNKNLFAIPLVAAFIVTSCTKTNLQPSPSNSTNGQTSSEKMAALFLNDDEVTNSMSDSGTNVVTYKSSPNYGQDIYATDYAGGSNVNFNYVPELNIISWIYNGSFKARAFLAFRKLSKFPDTLQIVSAKLYLYPPKDFLYHPQGNSGANECVVQRITQHGWNEDSLTWNNQPRGVTDEDEAFIPATADQFGYQPVIDVTGIVKKIVSGTVPNYGIRIALVNEQPYASVNFASSEAIDTWRRPKLVIEYK